MAAGAAARNLMCSSTLADGSPSPRRASLPGPGSADTSQQLPRRTRLPQPERWPVQISQRCSVYRTPCSLTPESPVSSAPTFPGSGRGRGWLAVAHRGWTEAQPTHRTCRLASRTTTGHSRRGRPADRALEEVLESPTSAFSSAAPDGTLLLGAARVLLEPWEALVKGVFNARVI